MSNVGRAFIMGISPTVSAAPFLGSIELSEEVGFNTGNLAFMYAVQRHLGPGVAIRSRGSSSEELNAAPEPIALLPCANHLGTHIDMGDEADVFAGLDKSIVAVGLGAQGPIKLNYLPELSQGSRRWLRELAERSPSGAANISVRGEYTMRVLEHYGVADKAVVLGCPSLFINPDVTLGRALQARTDEPIKRIGVVSMHYLWDHMWSLERSLARLVEETHGAYIIQSPTEMISAARGEWQLVPEIDRELMFQALFDGEFDESRLADWYQRYAAIFFDTIAWMTYLRTFDFVIGARIHGVMLALQAGVRALCLVHDSRTRELCETMQIPHVSMLEVQEGISASDLPRLYDFDGDAFDKRRQELASQYVSFMEGNGLNVDLGFQPASE